MGTPFEQIIKSGVIKETPPPLPHIVMRLQFARQAEANIVDC
jgi:hypothetical protein